MIILGKGEARMAFLNVAPLWTGGQSGERHRLIVLLEIGDLIPDQNITFSRSAWGWKHTPWHSEGSGDLPERYVSL